MDIYVDGTVSQLVAQRSEQDHGTDELVAPLNDHQPSAPEDDPCGSDSTVLRLQLDDIVPPRCHVYYTC